MWEWSLLNFEQIHLINHDIIINTEMETFFAVCNKTSGLHPVWVAHRIHNFSSRCGDERNSGTSIISDKVGGYRHFVVFGICGDLVIGVHHQAHQIADTIYCGC
jgi:hypothetical protein